MRSRISTYELVVLIPPHFFGKAYPFGLFRMKILHDFHVPSKSLNVSDSRLTFSRDQRVYDLMEAFHDTAEFRAYVVQRSQRRSPSNGLCHSARGAPRVYS